MRNLVFAACAAVATLTQPLVSQAGAASGPVKFDIEPTHTQVGFVVKHMMVAKVRGTFRDVAGQLSWDEKDMAKSTIEVTVNTTSIDTGVQQRDDDLRSINFFDVAKFPKITFKSTKVEKDGKGLRVTGDLNMHGVTKPIVLSVEGPSAPFKDPYGLSRTALSATGKINRRDFGLTWDKKIETGGLIVSDEVDIEINAELVHKDAPKT